MDSSITLNGADLTTEATSGLLGLTAGLLIVVLLVILALFILVVVGRWKLFTKAGEDGWKAIIPFYSDFVFVQISGLNWWYFLILLGCSLLSNTLGVFATLGNLFVYSLCFYNLGKKFHKDPVPAAILGALFNPIMTFIYGVDSSVYDKSLEVGKNGYIG